MDNTNTELIEKIQQLRKSRNAVILAHNFQIGEVQDIADFVGDSLEVIKQAAASTADVIVICGVHFMAETVSVVCPDKVILLPELHAGCTMSNMINAKELREKKKEHPNAAVVCYINTTAAVKAESDICCTATNAVAIVNKMPRDKEVLFVPDMYLGDYVANRTGHDLILWPGFCHTHSRIMPEDVEKIKAAHPEATVVVHPECSPVVRALADVVSNTGGILKFARETKAKEIIVGSELGILYRLRKENPDKTFIAATERAVCRTMKMVTLESIMWSLDSMTHRIEVPVAVRRKAKKAIDRMMEV